MSWSPTIYVKFPDEATARAMAASLGVEFPETGEIPTGNHNFALVAPIRAPWQVPPTTGLNDEDMVVETSPGTPEPGFWAMLRLNTQWSGYEATMAAIEAAGIKRSPEPPPAVFFGA